MIRRSSSMSVAMHRKNIWQWWKDWLMQPIDMMEINISCPNVNAGFLAFGQDAKHVEELTAQIKKIAKQPIIMKLTSKCYGYYGDCEGSSKPAEQMPCH